MSATDTGRGDLPSRAVIPFFLIAFGIAWGLIFAYLLAGERAPEIFGEISATHPLFITAVYAPAIAAILLVAVHTGAAGLGRFLSRLFLWRLSVPWLALLLIGLPAIYFAGSLAKGNAGEAPLFTETLTAILPVMVFMLVLGPVEEFGLRGLALPILQRHMAPLWAGLILGVIWGVWHMPAFFLSGTPQSAWGFTPFLVGSVAVSVILTPLFNRSGGSILWAALFHFQLNNPLWPDAQPYDTWVFVAAAALVVWVNRDDMLRRGGDAVTGVAVPTVPRTPATPLRSA
jgi:membrane protease YdiL (CAAX protease family)